MRVVTIPGVFQPRSDTWMLVHAVRRATLPQGARVLDLCTGSGVIGVAAALRGCAVTSVDVSRRALLSARVNARANGVRVRTRRGDLFTAVPGETFDLIVANPPYLPAASDDLPRRGPTRAWDAGRDAPRHLRPGGRLLVLHSSVCDVGATEHTLATHGLAVDVVLRHRGELGPLLRERADQLWADGRLPDGSLEEEIVIVQGQQV